MTRNLFLFICLVYSNLCLSQILPLRIGVLFDSRHYFAVNAEYSTKYFKDRLAPTATFAYNRSYPFKANRVHHTRTIELGLNCYRTKYANGFYANVSVGFYSDIYIQSNPYFEQTIHSLNFLGKIGYKYGTRYFVKGEVGAGTEIKVYDKINSDLPITVNDHKKGFQPLLIGRIGVGLSFGRARKVRHGIYRHPKRLRLFKKKRSRI